ncbi:MAG: hypothetical protein HDR24_00295 [Lachnospiraceae bacterium]|nr:hypothetical protein [Lachnospiraceae bacterium]
MTEQEAIKVINDYQFDCTRPETFKMIKALELATAALEEIQQYRNAGALLARIQQEQEGKRV